MPRIGITTGLILIVLAVGGYFGTGMKSWTALIPSFIGVPILLSSLLAVKPSRLKLGMHLAATFGLLGFIAAAGKTIGSLAKGTFVVKFATVAVAIMGVVCLVFIVLCIKSFKDARRARLAGN